MNEPKEKTYTVLWGMCNATYYVVKAKDEDEAVDRSGYNYDPDEKWAIESRNHLAQSSLNIACIHVNVVNTAIPLFFFARIQSSFNITLS